MKLTGKYKDNSILTCLVCAVFGLVLGLGIGWAI